MLHQVLYQQLLLNWMTRRKNNNRKKDQSYYIARYSGLAFEMLGIIVLGVFAGKKIDDYRQADFPLFTMILALLSVFVSLYLVIKDLINNGTKP